MSGRISADLGVLSRTHRTGEVAVVEENANGDVTAVLMTTSSQAEADDIALELRRKGHPAATRRVRG
jgi:hypothetical protein